MNLQIREHELCTLLIGFFLSQLLIPARNVAVNYAGNAAWISALITLAFGLLAALLLIRAFGQEDYFTACDRLGKWSGIFTFLLGLLFLFLAAIGFKGTLDVLEVYILSLTPRSLVSAILLLCILPGCFFGPAPISRMFSFYAPVAFLLFVLVLLVALPNNASVENLFPLFGDGLGSLTSNAGANTTAYLYLFVLLIERRRCEKALKTAFSAVSVSTLLIALGYLAFSLLNPPGSSTETAYPLHQLASLSGYWRYFQRMQSVFVFAWAPLLLCASAGGLCYSARCMGQALRLPDARVLVLPLGIALACLCTPVSENSPLWLRAILEGRLWYTTAVPILLVPLLLSAIRNRRQRRSLHAKSS